MSHFYVSNLHKKGFEEEFLALLEKHGIEYDSRHVLRNLSRPLHGLNFHLGTDPTDESGGLLSFVRFTDWGRCGSGDVGLLIIIS